MGVALAATTVTACGAPDELSVDDGVQLELSRDRVAAAVETQRKLTSSERAADRLVDRTRKIVASGSFEAERLDEFGLAALGELRLVVPSLVLVDRLEIPRELDRRALRAFLARAKSDPAAALEPVVDGEVARIAELLADAGAGADTEIPELDETVSAYLDDLYLRLRTAWPDLAADVDAIRDDI